MSLFFGGWFVAGWIALWVFIFWYSHVEWEKRGHDKKSGYEHTVSAIVSGVMALAIALTLNAAYVLNKYLPDENSILDFNGGKTKTEYEINSIGNKSGARDSNITSPLESRIELKTVTNDYDKTGEEKDKANVYSNVAEGSKTFNEFASFFTSPIAIILGFLAILFIIKIETERLQNERRHNRKKAEDNLVDAAHYCIELLKEFDRRHIDFFIRHTELKEKFGVELNTGILSKCPDLRKHIIDTTPAKPKVSSFFKQVGEWLPNICYEDKTHKKEEPKKYLSQELIKKLYFIGLNNKTRKKSLGMDSINIEVLRKLYYSSISTIFAEHVKRKTTDGYSDMSDDIKKIQSLLEDIFLRTDFNMNADENKCVVGIFLKIEQGIRDFYDIQSGVYTRKTSAIASNVKENRIKEKTPYPKDKNEEKTTNLEPALDEKKNKNEEKTTNLEPALDEKKNKNEEKTTNLEPALDEEKNKNEEKKTNFKPVLDEKKNKNEEKKTYSKSATIVLNKGMPLCVIGFNNYYNTAELNIRELRKKIATCDMFRWYLQENMYFSLCDINEFFDFYKALEKTHKNQFAILFEQMLSEDKAKYRAEKLAEFKGAYDQINEKNLVMRDEDKAQRCIDILITIWRECQSYYNYFELFKNLHDLKDALENRDIKKCGIVNKTILTFSDKECSDQNKYFCLKMEWFDNDNFCDYTELLKMYFEQHRSQSGDRMYEELFGEGDNGGVCEGIQSADYEQFLEALLNFLKESYIEEKIFRMYEKRLESLCSQESLKSLYGEVFYKKKER